MSYKQIGFSVETWMDDAAAENKNTKGNTNRVLVVTHGNSATIVKRRAAACIAMRRGVPMYEVAVDTTGNIPVLFATMMVKNPCVLVGYFLTPTSVWSPRTHSLYSREFRARARAVMFCTDGSRLLLEWLDTGGDTFVEPLEGSCTATVPPTPKASDFVTVVADHTPTNSHVVISSVDVMTPLPSAWACCGCAWGHAERGAIHPSDHKHQHQKTTQKNKNCVLQ